MSEDRESKSFTNIREHNVESSSNAFEKIEFYDVKKNLRDWRKENTCQQCCIIFANFQVLLDHKCRPYFCTTCSTSFQHDYMLSMHQCYATQSNSRNFRKTHCCEICQSSFPEKSALLSHQTFCSKKKQCAKCGKQLPIRAHCDFCRKCRFLLEKDKKYPLRNNTSSKFRMAQPDLEEHNNESDSLITDNKATADHKAEEFNHVNDRQSSVLSNLKRKRRSYDGVAENSSKKVIFDSNADAVTQSDTSLDNLDARCKYKTKFAKKDIESNLKNSLVTVLRTSSEKKRSDICSTSTADFSLKAPKTCVYKKPCNGISSFPSKNVKNTSDRKIFELDEPFPLAYPRVRRNPKRAECKGLTGSFDIKSPCKGNLLSRNHSLESTLTENYNKNCLNLSKKPKRHSAGQKTTVEPLTVDSENKHSSKTGESKKILLGLPITVNNLKKNIHLKGKKNILDQVSVKNSCFIGSNNKIEEFISSSKETNLKVNKSSPRLNSLKDPSISDNIKSSERKKLESSSLVRTSLRKSRKNIPNDQAINLVQGLPLPVRDGDKRSTTNERGRPSKSVHVSSKKVKNLRKSKNKILETASDKNCLNESGIGASDTTSTSSASKGKNTSFGKSSVKTSALSEIDKNGQDKIEKLSEVTVLPSKKVSRTVINEKNIKKSDSVKTISLLESFKMFNTEGSEKSETEPMTSKRKLKNKDNEKAKKVDGLSKKTTTKFISVKNSRLLENMSHNSRKINVNAAKQNANTSKINAKNKSTAATNSEPSIDCTPELEISESTLNLVPDAESSPVCHSNNRYSEKNLHKNGRVSNSENDTIKLESLFDDLPDGDSGLLLRVSSNTTDNYRCWKCSKLFKTIKLASVHYGNCKIMNRSRLNIIVSLKDILWICVNCNFQCNQESELSFHRRLCSKSSNDVSIDNCIRDYNNTCRNYCPKCSYSCISAIMFKSHNCEQNLEHMTKCVIDMEKISIKNIAVQKYECMYCESTFSSYNAYKKHIAKHKISSSEDSDFQNYSTMYDNSSATQEINSAIKQEPIETPEDVIKNWFDPVSSGLKKNSLLSNLNLLLPHKIEPLLCETAEKILEKERNAVLEAPTDFQIEKMVEILQKSSTSSSANANTLDSHFSNEAWLNYEKENCRCEKHENAIEKKPCLGCLCAYIKKKGLFHQPSDLDAPACRPDDVAMKTSDLSLDGNAQSMSDNLNILSSMEGQNTSSIHKSVSSCTNPVTPACRPDDVAMTTSANLSLDGNAQSMSDNLNILSSMEGQNTSSMHKSVSSCTNPVTSENSTLATSAANLSDMASSLSEMQNNNLMSNMQTELVDNSSDIPPDSMESKLIITFILILKGNFVDSKYTIDKHNNLIKSIYELKFGKVCDPYQVHPNEYYLLTEYYTKAGEESNKHWSEYMSLDWRQPRFRYDDSVLQNYFVVERPFVELIQLFFSQEPCDFDVVLCNNHLFIHLSWQFAPDICYSAFCVKSDSEPTGIQLICALCYDNVSIHLLVEHFDKVHQGAYTYNILIS